MTRRARNGRFMAEQHALPLLAAQIKNPAAVALGKHGAAVKADRQRAKVLRVMRVLRAELGLPA